MARFVPAFTPHIWTMSEELEQDLADYLALNKIIDEFEAYVRSLIPPRAAE